MRSEIIAHTADYIATIQQPSGAIPWFVDGSLDPWDHVEAAMGLSVGGHHEQAQAAYEWLAARQQPQGHWLAAYKDDAVVDGTRAETNFVAYIATGVWHHYTITGNRNFLVKMWPTVAAAIQFVLSLQAPTGEIFWAWDTRTGINKDALVTGCSAIYKSLECAIAAADELGIPAVGWRARRDALAIAIRTKPERFDRTWESKQRYSMDWFYPVLCGIIREDEARARLTQRWDQFVEAELGCRCVSDQPWVTVAESCELTLACLAAGEPSKAQHLFDCLSRYQAEDGSWWTGYAFKDEVMWPEERPTWTAGAVLLALDALTGHTAAADFFLTDQSANAPQHTERVSRR